MLIRHVLIAAAVVVPLASMPAGAAAQDRGRDRGSVESQHASNRGQGWERGHHTGRPSDLPPGIAKQNRTLPPGIARTRPQQPTQPTQPEPPATEPTPEPQPPEVCETVLTYVNGQLVLQDCNGNITPVLPF